VLILFILFVAFAANMCLTYLTYLILLSSKLSNAINYRKLNKLFDNPKVPP